MDNMKISIIEEKQIFNGENLRKLSTFLIETLSWCLLLIQIWLQMVPNIPKKKNLHQVFFFLINYYLKI